MACFYTFLAWSLDLRLPRAISTSRAVAYTQRYTEMHKARENLKHANSPCVQRNRGAHGASPVHDRVDNMLVKKNVKRIWKKYEKSYNSTTLFDAVMPSLLLEAVSTSTAGCSDTQNISQIAAELSKSTGWIGDQYIFVVSGEPCLWSMDMMVIWKLLTPKLECNILCGIAK